MGRVKKFAQYMLHRRNAGKDCRSFQRSKFAVRQQALQWKMSLDETIDYTVKSKSSQDRVCVKCRVNNNNMHYCHIVGKREQLCGP